MKQKIISVFIILSMLIPITVFSEERSYVDNILTKTARYIYETVENPQFGTTGGEWAVLGLARSNAEIPEEYYQLYYNNIKRYIKDCGGILHDKKYTEYSRLITALTSIGKNPSDVGGFNLLMPLGDCEKITWQGINGPVWALIALDSGGYEIPLNENAKVQATRDLYLDRILQFQMSDGGFSLSYNPQKPNTDITPEPDITAMVLIALAKYREREEVKTCIEKALNSLSAMQNENGGFEVYGVETSESASQVITALCELAIDINDERFVKNSKSVIDNLLTFYCENGGFKHTHKDVKESLMSTEQALYSLAALKRFENKENSLFTMTDTTYCVEENTDLTKRNKYVKIMPRVYDNKTFLDISESPYRTAIEKLAAHGIISGMTDDTFDDKNSMTRAQFATIIVRALGLDSMGEDKFSDVLKNDWFYDYVNTAYHFGIVNGVSEAEFNPNGTITREEAAVMTARAAKLCGLETQMDLMAAKDILAGFFDYVKASDWAMISLGICVKNNIISDEEMYLEPKKIITRGEIAQMIYNLLRVSELI